MKKKVGLISLGCPKNLVDSEIMLGKIKSDVYEITNNIKEADAIIVNTCGFIESAKQESINTILEACNEKNENAKCVIVTGCLAERYRDEIMKEMPEVDAVIGTGNYAQISEILDKAFEGQKIQVYGKLDDIEYLNSNRVVTTGKGYAYLKIAEGCDNKCTYCIIPSLRGEFRSRKQEDILKDAENLVSQGIKELILVAQDTTRYGIDLYGKYSLVSLLRKLGNIDKLKWIRILYLYPECITDELIDEIASNKKIVKYLDIPFQHASDSVLRRMGRKGTNQLYTELVQKLKDRIDNLILRTTFIVGFPEESEQDFNLGSCKMN